MTEFPRSYIVNDANGRYSRQNTRFLKKIKLNDTLKGKLKLM